MARPDFDLIVFDYDGVIADSELLNHKVLIDLLEQIGLPTTLDFALSKYLGKRWTDTELLIAERLGAPCPDHVQDAWFRNCHDLLERELQSVQGFDAFFKRRNEARCIASSSPPNWIEIGLKQFGVMEAFSDRIFSGSVHVERGKPHPDIFLYAADAMKVAPHRALVIEDSPAGVVGGVAAGMTVVGLCAAGHIRGGHADSLKAAGAHHVFDSYAQIEDWLVS